MGRHRALDRQERRDFVVLEDDLTVWIDDEADIEEAILPIFVARLGLRHDEHVPLPCKFSDLVSLRPRNIDTTRAGIVGMIDIQHFVIEAHQRALGDREQTNWNVKIGQPEGRLGQALEMLDVMFDLLAPTNTPETRYQADRIVGLDHSFPHRIKVMPGWRK